MTDTNTSWFHCGRCGSLYQAPVGQTDDHTCSVCGRNPSLGFEVPALESVSPSNSNATDGTERHADRERHSPRRNKGRYFMAKLVLVWSVVLVAIVFGARHLWHDDSNRAKPFVSQLAAKPIIPDADVALLAEVTPLCSAIFSNYLSATTPEARNQFVLTPITTAPRMARFYSLNPLVEIDPKTMALASTSVLHLPGRRAIESQWRAADNRLFDAVFIEENAEWRLDWDHYVRYSDNPWALFLAGGGEDHGEFRLLARERLAEERKNEDAVSIVLYAPRFGYAGETGAQSPEFLVQRDTRNGRLLDAAFKLERSGGRVFGANLPNINPEELIRVRVNVRRVENDEGRRFELEDVVACHWYSVAEPGVDIPEQAADK